MSEIPTTFVEPTVQHDHPKPDAPGPDAEAAATPATTAPIPDAPAAQPAQKPIAAGTYAIYDDTQGGYVFVIGTREGETLHKHFPARVVRMAEMAMGGNSPLSALLGINV